MTDKKKLVILTGAGISAESGLKTFRDSDGLWEGYNVYDVASPGGWQKDPAMVLDFYNMRRRNVLDAKPNAAHQALAELEDYFSVSVITQNIDDLHERAGSSKVLHLHGEIFKMRSEWNESIVLPIHGDILLGDKASDGGQLRPNIVWFEEPVPLIVSAGKLVQQADIFLIIGTSLAVYPAAGLVNFARKDIPKFILDKNIPYVDGIRDFYSIKSSASGGIRELKSQLLKLI